MNYLVMIVLYPHLIKSDFSAAELLGCVKSKIDKFVGDAPQFDDITMMALRYFGGNKVKELTIDATVKKSILI